MSLSEKEYYNLTVSISKALSSVEMPLKVKHARAAIIGTFHSRGAHSFWAIAIRQPLQENRIVAWKFCHLLHKVLREGHPLCCQHSLRHRTMLSELGKLWGHLTDGYGKCIKDYTKLLITKLDFHDRNPRFPGHLQLKRGELTYIAGNDINFYFQLCVELFDYLDDILSLQSTIFSSITMYRVNSMTPTGQCRLAPLIPLIQDSNQLYDFIVRIMFKLHANLSNELLGGHRERFRQIFDQLKKFFQQSSELQYFVNLITVPRLPENAPNFKSQIDLSSYIAPVVVVPEQEPDLVVDNLVDTSEPAMTSREVSPSNAQKKAPEIDFRELLKERDELIQHLQFEVERLGKHIKTVTIESREEHSKLEEELASLNSELSNKQEQLTNMRLVKEDLELKLQTATPSLEKKAQAEEERARTSEEKFQKLKTMYTQIRDEHVKLLRQHGEVSRTLASSTKLTADSVKEKEEIKAKLEEIQHQQKKADELMQKSSAEDLVMKNKLEMLENEKISLHAKYEDLEANKSAEIAELSISLDRLKEQLKELEKNLESQKEQESDLFKNHKTELENVNKEFSTFREETEKTMQLKEQEIVQLNQTVKENEVKHKNELEEEKNSIMKTIKSLEMTLKDNSDQNINILRGILKTCVSTTEKLAIRGQTDDDIARASGTSAYFLLISEELQDILKNFTEIYGKYLNDNSRIDELIEKIITSGYLLASIHDQCLTICTNSSDIEMGERILEKVKQWYSCIKNFYDTILNETQDPTEVRQKLDDVEKFLKEITEMICDLCKKSKSTDQLGDLVEAELAGMDKAIEEAAKKIQIMLSQSRAKDSGIKLEVNEKILDACTNLMECIRVLVQKSRLLQAEIIVLGKGTASAKEFYKRNHQWTEGLISAAKSVGQGANFLVTASNKAVSGDAKHQLDLIVAAQEIAASTAQLVVSSRVKASRDSQNFKALSDASKKVTQATGAVVATAKDSSQILEETQDLDLTTLTVHQVKTLDMEMQVKILELEQSLQMERLRLAAFRRKNYQAPADEK